MTHAQLVKSIMDLLEFLRLSGKPVLAAKTATCRTKLESGRYIDTGRPGWPDITACISGRLVMVECKVGRDTQRHAQIEMQGHCEAAGGFYLLATGLEPLRNYLRGEGLL